MKSTTILTILLSVLVMASTLGDATQGESTSDLAVADEVDTIPDIDIYRGLKGGKGDKQGRRELDPPKSGKSCKGYYGGYTRTRRGLKGGYSYKGCKGYGY
mmetsp:Transcript_14002/g.28936  ORF Transcript_14002/g.28936 Transcript_14002/m.28936 type:complete len:101 (-) Transcript_14002:457-759(-)